MKIIMDACTAILLAKSSVIEILTDTKEIKMTKQVYEEIIKGKEKMFEVSFLIESLKKKKKIHLINDNKEITEKLMKDFNMGEGEASTISAGIENKSIIATDNLQGRKASRVNNLQLVGSPELIISLFKRKKITLEKTRVSLKKLKEEGWFETNLIEKLEEDINNGKS